MVGRNPNIAVYIMASRRNGTIYTGVTSSLGPRVWQLTGSGKAFAAGADIKEMADKGYLEMYAADWFRGWEDLTRLRIPR
jgi:enoyl-CoA hydratase